MKFDVTTLRGDFPALDEMVFLNNGAVGISPAPVVAAMVRALERGESRGQDAYAYLNEQKAAARAALAGYLGADAGEVAFANNATEAVNWIVASLRFKPGEQILMSDYEHPALIYPVTWQRDHGHVNMATFHVASDPEITFANLEAAITPATRLIAVSHVERHNGIRLPAERICALAAERGILSLVDGAQSVGMFPVDVRSVGADFYIGNLHKWLCGPNGTGLLHVRADRLHLLEQAHVGPSGARGETKWDLAGGLILPQTAGRFEYGTTSTARFPGVLAALAYLTEIGAERIEEQLRALKVTTEQQIADRGWRLLSPKPWEHSSALVSFMPPGDADGSVICQELAENSIYLSATQDGGVRISPHFYNTDDEIGRALAAVASAANC